MNVLYVQVISRSNYRISKTSFQNLLPLPIEILEHVHIVGGVDGELVDEVGDDGRGHPLPGVAIQ